MRDPAKKILDKGVRDVYGERERGAWGYGGCRHMAENHLTLDINPWHYCLITCN